MKPIYTALLTSTFFAACLLSAPASAQPSRSVESVTAQPPVTQPSAVQPAIPRCRDAEAGELCLRRDGETVTRPGDADSIRPVEQQIRVGDELPSGLRAGDGEAPEPTFMDSEFTDEDEIDCANAPPVAERGSDWTACDDDTPPSDGETTTTTTTTTTTETPGEGERD